MECNEGMIFKNSGVQFGLFSIRTTKVMIVSHARHDNCTVLRVPPCVTDVTNPLFRSAEAFPLASSCEMNLHCYSAGQRGHQRK